MPESTDPNAIGAAITVLAIAAVIVTALIASIYKRRANLEVIKHALERGQQLDERVVQLLLGRAAPRDQQKDLRFHGAIWLCIGIGFTLFAFVAFGTSNRVVLGVAVMIVAIGAGMIAASRLVARSIHDQ